MAIHIQLRRDTSAVWAFQNPVLSEGEIGLETDLRRFKIGDGILPWNQLGYGGLTGTSSQVEIFQLTSQNIIDKKVVLTLPPVPSIKTRVSLQGGPTQIVNVDFYVSGNEIRWDSLGLETLASISDWLVIEYFV